MSRTLEPTESAFDVVVYDNATRTISAVVGTSMSMEKADKRVDTMLARINEEHGVEIVPSGLYAKGSILARPIAEPTRRSSQPRP